MEFSKFLKGADLSHIFCPKEAGIPIKSYSPELIVHPTLPDLEYSKIREDFLKEMKFWMQSLHGFIIGPGLGRKDTIDKLLIDLLGLTNAENQIFVLDADGIYFFLTNENLLRLLVEKKNLYLTPNAGEFDRLWKHVMKDKGIKYINFS